MRRLLLICNVFVVSLLSSMNVYAYDAYIDGIYYNLSGNKAAVTYKSNSGPGANYNAYVGSVTIPSTITYDGTKYSVTSIGDWAFNYCYDLTSVTIPNSVKSIGSWAFFLSGLTSVNIPNSVTSIGSNAFADCSGLSSISIPNSVTSIGSGAFQSCSGLISVLIPNSVTSIGDYTFAGCSGLVSVSIPNSVTSIGSGAFIDCDNLGSVTNLSTTPQGITGNTFSNYGTLYVPKGSQAAYEAAPYWKDFTIVGIDTDGIRTVEGTKSVPLSHYSINGIRTTNQQRGINIVKMSDGSVRKVLRK